MERKMTPVTEEMLSAMEAGFDARPGLQVMANVMAGTELDKAAFVPSGAAKLRMDFSVVVPTNGITNQKSSGRCWMFSTMNLFRERVCSKCNVDDFSFSCAYLAFYDKLEKCNHFLELAMKYADQELSDRETWMLMANPLPDGGQFDMVISLLKKYGAVPSWVMPETVSSSGTSQAMPILTRKLREDALELRKMVREGRDPQARKEEMLAEMYNALRILYGQPPKTFDFEYTDKDKAYHCDAGLTPRAFLEKYVGTDLDDYVVLIASPIHEVHRTYSQPDSGNLVEDGIFWLNITEDELENLAIRQLKAGEAVCFSCDCHPDRERAQGYWDPDTFQYGEVLGGMTFGMNKAERLLSGESTMNHCMMFCGVNLDAEGRPNRWKIENSWGDANGQKGYYIGSEKWFRNTVYQIIVRREMLSNEQRALLNQEPIPMAAWDPLM